MPTMLKRQYCCNHEHCFITVLVLHFDQRSGVIGESKAHELYERSLLRHIPPEGIPQAVDPRD